MSAFIGSFLSPAAGLLFGGAVVGYNTAEAFSKSLWQAQEAEIKDFANTTESLAYVTVPAAGTEERKGTVLSDYPVDALIGAEIYWIFTDDNTESHELNIKVKLKYYNYYVEKNITTSKVLKVVRDAGNTLDSPYVRGINPGTYLACLAPEHDVADCYKIWMTQGQSIQIWLYPPSDADFDLYLYGPGTDPNRPYKSHSSNRGNGQLDYIYFPIDTSGYWYIKAKYYSGPSGLYTLKVNRIEGQSGCPFLYDWNGQEYVIDNNLLRYSSRSNGSDIQDYYRLEQNLVPIYEGFLFSSYSLQIREFQHEHSYIDQVKLLAVDHDSDVNIAASPNGNILTYKNPSQPISCINSNGTDMLHTITATDDQYYLGSAGDHLLLDFGDLDINNGAKLVMRADDYGKWSIHVQIRNSNDQWQTIADIIPRNLWATEILDLKPYLPDPYDQLKIRLFFTNTHKIDYIGLDTTPQAEIETHTGLSAFAIHSEEGVVTLKLLLNDEIYTELTPSQQITMIFVLPNPEDKRTFVLYIDGYYYTP